MPQFSNMPNVGLQIDTEAIARDFGYTFSSTNFDQSRERSDFDYILKSLEDIDDLNDLFDTNLGRWGNIWFPSWIEDFSLTGDISGSSTILDVKTTEDFSTYYPTSDRTGRNIFIFVSESEWYTRRVTGYDTDSIYIDAVLGKDISRSRVKFISFLYAGRFNQDEIEWKYITPSVAKVSISFVELPHEYTTTSSTSTSTTSTTVAGQSTISTTTSSTMTTTSTSSTSSTASTTSSSTSITTTTSSTSSTISTTSSTASTSSTSPHPTRVTFDGEEVTFDGDTLVFWTTTTTSSTAPP